MVARQKAVKTLKKIRKDLKLKGKKKNASGMLRRNATVVLAQGALGAPRRNFGTRQVGRGKYKIAALRKALDARIPRTLGLPRAVGPYTVIRTTNLFSLTTNFVLFAPFKYDDPDAWYDWCGVAAVAGTDDVTGGSNTKPLNMPMAGLGDACEVVPAALTVQVMNPASLQTADGLFAMCRVNQQMDLGNTPAGTTYNDMAARVLSFYSPRLLTGGKLALRGVKCSSYPLDMSEYSDFRKVKYHVGPVSWGQYQKPAALAPIVFIQDTPEGVSPKTLDFMVTIEWRVRFDPSNPATASHTYHDTLPDDAWNAVMKAEAAAGHAVRELSEDAATHGIDESSTI